MVVTLSLLNRFSRLFTLCLKKFPPLNYLKLCQNLTIFKNFCTAGKVRNLLQHHMTVMLLHYLEKLKIQIFRRYSADMEENANKLHLCINFNSSMPRPPNSWQFLTSQKSFLRIKSCFCAQCNIEEAKNNHCQEISVCYRGWGVLACSVLSCMLWVK